uniref:Uncharacterized protein n=1 Tax=Zooxanthella nutricula TaxID=1333877 RepID=A0A7S2PJQ4_9DINO
MLAGLSALLGLGADREADLGVKAKLSSPGWPGLRTGCHVTKQRSGKSMRFQAADMPPMCNAVLFGDAGDLAALVASLRGLPEMDKHTMGGRCEHQTRDMEHFMTSQVGMRQLSGQCFVQGVKAFELKTPLAELPADRTLSFACQRRPADATFSMSVAEVAEWQASYQAFYASDMYVGEEGKACLRKALSGQSSCGDEAFRMKFVVRISKNPVLMRFDGRLISREADDCHAGEVHLVSVCGVDFAGRKHDVADVTTYIRNWRQVYRTAEEGNLVVRHGRDFVPTGKKGFLDRSLLLRDLKKMARLRLRAQDAVGVQVAVEVGIGLGVFAGDAVGIGARVRLLSAQALREVLEEERFEHIRLVVVSLPVFRPNDNFQHFRKVFENGTYKGATPVMLMDQDMHAIAISAAAAGFSVGELNPADSHGVFGEYWQNLGPGTEEKLALTTCGLLTQHHAVNPWVLDASRYTPMDV